MVTQQRYEKHFFISLLLHIVLLTILVVSFEWNAARPVFENANQDVIEAIVMNDVQVTRKVIQQPAPQPIPEPEKPIKVEPSPPKTETIAIPEKKIKKPPQDDMIQKELLADLQKQHQKQKQKNLQAEFEKEMTALKAEALQHQMEKEQKRLAGLKAQKTKGVVDKYKALVLQTISQHWLIPSGVDKKKSAELLVHIAPGGVVLNVQLTKSSGDEALDRSARAAVLKSSPLPVPADADAFEPFRQFVLKVKPENVLSNDSWLSS